MQHALAAQLPWSSSPWLLCWDVSSVSSSISSSSSSSSSCGEGRSTASVAGGGCMGERYKWDIFRAGSSAATAQLPSTPTAGRDNLFQLAVHPVLQLPMLMEPEDLAALQPPTCSEFSEVDLLDGISALFDSVESTETHHSVSRSPTSTLLSRQPFGTSSPSCSSSNSFFL